MISRGFVPKSAYSNPTTRNRNPPGYLAYRPSSDWSVSPPVSLAPVLAGQRLDRRALQDVSHLLG
eukprot:scaffold597357_cov44-Prasinocladus_malaysianus.AAC.1